MALVGLSKGFLNLPFRYHIAIAFLIRLLLIIYSEYHDAVSEVPYTDIDYKVFTDAARYIWNGQSPYLRHTYRYSPLLAVLLISNITLHICFGKVLFSIIDVCVGILIKYIVYDDTLKIFSKENVKSIDKTCNNYAHFSMFLWIYNPVAIIIATRGNSDALAALLVLFTLFYLQCKKSPFIAGLFHGLAIHIRLYPIVFSFTMFMHLSDYSTSYFEKKNVELSVCNETKSKIEKLNVQNEKKTVFKKKYLSYLVPNYSQLKLIAGTILSLCFFTATCYYIYGYKFLYETYLYHFIRKDPRHNFSVFFYITYLTADIKNIGIWQRVLTFLPNAVLLIVISIQYGLQKESLYFGIFAQAFLMVTYNSVVTSQYFIWFISILPLLIWQFKMTLIYSVKLFFIWVVAQLAWLLPAYLLEFQGQNTFLLIWLQSIAFFSANILILSRLVKNFSPIPSSKQD